MEENFRIAMYRYTTKSLIRCNLLQVQSYNDFDLRTKTDWSKSLLSLKWDRNASQKNFLGHRSNIKSKWILWEKVWFMSYSLFSRYIELLYKNIFFQILICVGIIILTFFFSLINFRKCLSSWSRDDNVILILNWYTFYSNLFIHITNSA